MIGISVHTSKILKLRAKGQALCDSDQEIMRDGDYLIMGIIHFKEILNIFMLCIFL